MTSMVLITEINVGRTGRRTGARTVVAVDSYRKVLGGWELKQGYSGQRHALVAAKNLKLLMSGGKESKLSAYGRRSSFMPKIIVSLARQDAVAQFSFTTIFGLVPGMIKSKNLYVGKNEEENGAST
ncbi:hypothetical protein MTR67_049200 [Solanum verrucosum]|uniref:Uncharacterized protein n=1 Tax=Solanum verrucosum TaxID=315347 RepID=A0AAF0V0Z0_SOLVR|nr:hypothetical protein MTR67_049200 [Solanum verrucosum]